MKAKPETLSPQQAAFLVRQRVARLATADAAGAPHAPAMGPHSTVE